MALSNKERSRRNCALVREVLMREWDPIGVRDHEYAQNEYDRYGAKAYVMLVDDDATAEEIARYLLGLEQGVP